MDKKDTSLFLVLTTALLLVYVIFERKTFLKNPQKPPKLSAVNKYIEDKMRQRKMSSSVDWEEMTLHDPPVKNWRSVASSKTSRISVVNKKAKHYVGDTVTVKIIIKDVDGHRKTKGGDEIRIWTNGGKLTGTAGTVLDNGDGTYQGRVKILWPGRITINAKVFTPREKIAYLYRNVRYGNTSRVYFGGFSDGLTNETVRCTGNLNLASTYNGSCDLNRKTLGLPWFCEKPKYLSCSNWTFSQLKLIPLNLTQDQKEMVNRVTKEFSMRPLIGIIAENRTNNINVQSSGTALQSPVPCNKIPARETWRARTPVGYAHKGRWFPLFCTSSTNTSENSTRECLKGRRLWLIGDSTTRQMFTFMVKNLTLKLTTAKWSSKRWYNLSIAEDVLKTFSIAYAVHGLPFGFQGKKVASNQLNATHSYINSIPAGSKDIILVHFYTHFHTQHPEVLRQSVQKTITAIKRLKNRAPNSTVIVKGPHAMTFIEPPANDFWGNVYTKIFREEFKKVRDDVIYLDLWDMTVASRNPELHPNVRVLSMIMNYFISLVCP